MSRAAVAVVVVGAGEGELLLIERPRRAGDRWSGHLAFPGGLAQPGDRGLVDTARREAHEEVGVTLGSAAFALPDVWTGRPGGLRPMRVTPVVFRVDARPELRLDEREVADAFFVEVARLRAARRRWMVRRVAGLPVPFPWIDLEGRRLWGLTLQMIDALLRR